MTIYRMYIDHGNRAGFWVQHRTWQNACARVDSIGGQEIGPLPGRAPTHNEAEVRIRAFDVRSGRPIDDLGERIDSPCDQHFSVIAEPRWFRASPLQAMASSGSRSKRTPVKQSKS